MAAFAKSWRGDSPKIGRSDFVTPSRRRRDKIPQRSGPSTRVIVLLLGSQTGGAAASRVRFRTGPRGQRPLGSECCVTRGDKWSRWGVGLNAHDYSERVRGNGNRPYAGHGWLFHDPMVTGPTAHRRAV